MNNGKDEITLNSGHGFNIPPIKRGSRYLNSLVIRGAISLALSWWTMSSADPEIQGLINEAGGIVILPGFFTVYLVLVSIVESLLLLIVNTFNGIFS